MTHKVLIVDSEQVQCDLLTHSLQNRLGYRTAAAPSVQEAVQHFHSDLTHKPDMILFDWPVPERNDAAEQLKALASMRRPWFW